MHVLNDLKSDENFAVAIGFFDGVHSAHQKVITDCVSFAKKNNIKSAVLTFKTHPCMLFNDFEPQYITTCEQRTKKISALGVDYIFMLDFSKDFAELQPDKFVELLTSSLNIKAIFTGFNFFFGKNKSGNTKTLADLSQKLNYRYFEVPQQLHDGVLISSTNTRNFLKNGEISNANALLGYDFSITSEVIYGNQIGRTINFPTANIIYPKGLVKLKFGVYSAKIDYKGEIYSGVMNFGLKPTVDNNNNLSVEVHILNFNEDIYSQTITIFPQKYIREQKKFDSLTELKNQIYYDIMDVND